MDGTIVCGYDGTPASVEAVRFAHALGAAAGREVVAVTVSGRWPETEGRAMTAVPRDPGVPGVRRWYVSARSPALGLHDAACLARAWLLVLGAPAASGSGRVHHQFLNGAPCPVAVVPERRRDGAAATIGVVWDGTAAGSGALDFAQDLGQALHAGVVVGHGPGVDPRGVLSGVTTRELADVRAGAVHAWSADLDLLVLCPSRPGPAGTVLLGTVTGKAVDRVACPVVVVPRADVPAAVAA